MSSVQVTPRKRKSAAAEGLLTPQSTRKTRTKAAPAPNPPLAPFPTPPSSRTRRFGGSDVIEDFEPLEVPIAKASENRPLPTHLQTLLTIHHAFNLALSLYIATKPPILPPHPPSTVRLQLPCLTNYLAIRETVERTGGRRFSQQELARLAWIWQWDGATLPKEEHATEDDNPFLVKRDGPPANPEAVCAMSYLITPTRTIDASGKRVQTYGLGIELDLKPGETRQLLHNGAEGGLGNKGQGGGMGAVGRWNTSGEFRHDLVREKLEKWIDLNGGYEPPVVPDHGLPTPSTSNSTRSTIPPVPMLPLPKLASGLLPAANLFASASTSAAGLPGLTTPPKKVMNTAGLSDPFALDEPVSTAKSGKAGSVEDRRRAMQERIKKRSEASKGPMPTLGSAINSGYKVNMSAAAQQEELKRRSTLSRLESVAEGVWMLFSAPGSSSSASMTTPPRTRRKTIPLSEVADVIVKSSKTPISLAEAETSLSMLTDLCPFFLTSRTIGRQEWLEMPANVAHPPSPSPGSYIPSGPSVAVPAFTGTGGPPTSPSPKARSRLGGDLAGPASPGRVRRVGGLREVRERIRKELGDW